MKLKPGGQGGVGRDHGRGGSATAGERILSFHRTKLHSRGISISSPVMDRYCTHYAPLRARGLPRGDL